MSVEWYEMGLLSIGIVLLGVFVLVSALAGSNERRRKEHMWHKIEKQLRLPRLVVALVLVFTSGGVAWSQETSTSVGEVCFRLLSFDDTLSFDVVQFSTPPDAPSFFTFGAHWEARLPNGELFYELTGGGTAVFNPQAAVLTLDVVLRNATPFFGDQRLCRLNGATDPALSGTWAVTCSGLVPPRQGGTPFLAQGTLLLIPCGLNLLPPGDPIASTARFSVQAQGQYAGVGQ
jgi:hypothetical protein